MTSNLEIRRAIKKTGLFQWQVAERYGVSESQFSRMLRRELPDEEKRLILNIIEQLKEGK
ncbi:2-oxoglutarate and iron-dependent oxygenase domain-containing protein [Bacillus cabrialesii]|uniref:hypothetical protein n=1 Tax=Bacillus cabrialesii TaxID=2487276 RepID=UPI0010104AE5|nr:hypothetical protein [Bacillus cabrialesii]UQE80243.1 2-oxoglutarate and iron-dependent oxygenase domain-containing protein [Bacillus cabrialesii]